MEAEGGKVVRSRQSSGYARRTNETNGKNMYQI